MAELMFVGEQPGDQEDLAGQAVCRAGGQGVRRGDGGSGAAAGAGLCHQCGQALQVRAARQKRLHQRPNMGEVKACKFWLNLEREFVKPKLIVALGATAVSGLAGSGTTLSSVRGKITELEDGTRMFATVHPSYLLRMPDREEAAREQERFVEDLRGVKRAMGW